MSTYAFSGRRCARLQPRARVRQRPAPPLPALSQPCLYILCLRGRRHPGLSYSPGFVLALTALFPRPSPPRPQNLATKIRNSHAFNLPTFYLPRDDDVPCTIPNGALGRPPLRQELQPCPASGQLLPSSCRASSRS